MAAAIVTSATTLEEQFVEVANALASLEKAVTVEPIPNNIAIVVGYETNLIQVTATLPITVTPQGTGFKVVANEYLD